MAIDMAAHNSRQPEENKHIEIEGGERKREINNTTGNIDLYTVCIYR